MSMFDALAGGMMYGQVISKSLDALNGQPSTPSAQNLSNASWAEVQNQSVAKTLDNLNAAGTSPAGVQETYALGKDVLGAYLTGRGALTDLAV